MVLSSVTMKINAMQRALTTGFMLLCWKIGGSSINSCEDEN